MSTLGEMITAIRRETRRNDTDWPDRCRDEILRAIRHYRRERFFFNETREITFNTVIGQDFYDATAHPDIPNLLQIDYVQITDAGWPRDLCPRDADELDRWNGLNPTSLPLDYCYFEQKLRLYPKPNKAYPIRISAVVRAPEPATDDEAGNPWMTEAEELIRSRAKRNLYLHHMGDREEAASMQMAEREAFDSLKVESANRMNVDTLTSWPVI